MLSGIMQLKNQPNFSVFILLILRSFTAAVSAHYNVSVICDSYGVVLDWKSSELSQETEFDLELKDDSSNVIFIKTSSHRYNVSDELRNTAFNRFYVNVMVRGKNKSAQSPIFSFCSYRPAEIICGLEFPPIILGPQDGQLSVTFVNPLRLYQKTPALRNLTPNEKLHYQVKGNQTSDEFICSSDSEVCKSTLSFPEVEEEYCVTVSGSIRQTPFREQSQCYRGTLNPGPSVLTYIIPLLIGLPAVAILVLAARTLTKAIDRKMKKKHIAKIPAFLKKDDRLPPTQFTLLPPESMPVTEITKVDLDLDLKIPPICDFPESTDLQKTPANSKQIMDSTDETDYGSDNTEQEDKAFDKDPYSDMSSGGFTGAYDSPHTLIEMSPGDMVSTYGTRPFLD